MPGNQEWYYIRALPTLDGTGVLVFTEDNIYELSCGNLSCQWKERSEKMQVSRILQVAMYVGSNIKKRLYERIQPQSKDKDKAFPFIVRKFQQEDFFWLARESVSAAAIDHSMGIPSFREVEERSVGWPKDDATEC